MAARAKDVETGRKGGASSSSSDAFSSPAQKAKGNPRASQSSVAGSSPDRGATTGRHVPHYLRPTISSYHGRAATDPQPLAKATRQPAHPKSPSPSPSSSSSSSKSTSTRRKSYSTSTSPKEGSSKASNVPFSKSAVFSRSASTKLMKPHERGSSTTTTTTSAAAKPVATKKSKGSVTSDLRKAVSKANKDASPTSGEQDRAEEKTVIVQEPQGTHIGKDLKNSVASDPLHVSSDQLTQTAAATTVNIAADDSNDPADLKMAALSKEPQAGAETFSPKNPASNTELNAEDTHIEESRDKAKILDVVQTKEGFDADASAINGAYDSGDMQKNAEEEEEGEANREQAEAEDGSCIDPTDSLNRKEDGAKETADGERVAEPSTPNHGTPNSREGKELCRASVLSPTTEDGENKPRKLEFRRGTIVSPKIEDDANTPRKLEFRKGTVLPRKPEEEDNTPRKLEFRRGRAADKDNEQGGSQEKDGAVVYNQVIEETASKLVGARKSKVRALVGAFETVISIHETDAQSSQHAPAPSASASDPASPAGPLPPSGSTPPPASHVRDPLPDSASIPPPSPNSALNLDEDPSAPTAQGQEEEDKADGKEEEEEDDDEKEEGKEKEDEDEEKAAFHHD